VLNSLIDSPVLSTTFKWDSLDKPPPHEYSRISNPNREELEKTLAKLENGRFAFALSSGQAATFLLFSTLKQGDHILCLADVYDGTIRSLKILERFGIEHTLIEPKDIQSIKSKVKENTKLVILESPSSNLLNTFNIRKIKEEIGEILLVVDSTVATPIFQKPLNLGADVVIHSLTKFINGNDDSTGGALITNNQELAEQLSHLQHTIGFPLAPFDCWLTMRGIRTLEQRMEKHTSNAEKLVSLLSTKDFIEKINYPGFSGLLSFKLNTNKLPVLDLFSSLKEIPIASSYGGAISRIHQVVTMVTSNLNDQTRKNIGLTEDLIRISVGLEDSEELLAGFLSL